MQHPIRHALRCASILAALLLAGEAHAQAVGLGIPVVPVTSTNGLKVGIARLHGFFDLEGRFDSAAGFFNSTGTLTLSPEFIMHFRPGIRLEIPASWVNLYLGGYIDYVYYTGLITPNSQLASRLEGNADLEVAFNQSGPVEVDVGDLVNRSDRTRSSSIGVGVLSLSNEAHLSVPIRPGGGALEITPRASYLVELFQSISGLASPGCTDASCEPGAVALLNYQDITGGLQAKLKFLPKTAVLIDGSYDARRYFSASSTSPPASILRVTGGLAGLITSRLTTTAKFGWAKDFATSAGVSDFIAQVELNYLLTDVISFKAGYQRSLDAVPIYGTSRDDRIYAEVQAQLAGALSLRLFGAYDWLAYFNNSNRFDHALVIDFGPQYQVFPWFFVGAGYIFSSRDSNNNQATSFNYQRHEAYVRLTVAY